MRDKVWSEENRSGCRQNVRMTRTHGSVSQTECLAVEKIGFCRSCLFLAGTFKSSPFHTCQVELCFGAFPLFSPFSTPESMALILCGISVTATTNTLSLAGPPYLVLAAVALLGC